MKRCITIILAVLLLFTMSACVRNERKDKETDDTAHNTDVSLADSSLEEETPPITNSDSKSESESESESPKETEEDIMKADKLYIKVGETILTAVLEDNESAKALKELLADGPRTISASNYGGFEKVCDLGTDLPRNDRQTTTQAGDICLYSGDQIVIFYGSNSWAYTKLGKIENTNAKELKAILSGEETEVTLSLTAPTD